MVWRRYTDAKAQHLQRALLQHLPKNYQSLTEKYRQTGDAARDIDMSEYRSRERAGDRVAAVAHVYALTVRKPKLDGVVFCRVVDDVGEYTVHDRCVRSLGVFRGCVCAGTQQLTHPCVGCNLAVTPRRI